LYNHACIDSTPATCKPYNKESLNLLHTEKTEKEEGGSSLC
jgi:hypothetical protein